MELKIIGVKGLGVVWETEIDERCNDDDYCEFDIWWVTNFKLNNGNCVFRRKIESWEGEEGNEEVEEEYDYFYIVNDVLDSKFKRPFIKYDDNGPIKVSEEEIKCIDDCWDKLEYTEYEDLDIECDCGFDEITESDLNIIMNE